MPGTARRRPTEASTTRAVRQLVYTSVACAQQSAGIRCGSRSTASTPRRFHKYFIWNPQVISGLTESKSARDPTCWSTWCAALARRDCRTWPGIARAEAELLALYVKTFERQYPTSSSAVLLAKGDAIRNTRHHAINVESCRMDMHRNPTQVRSGCPRGRAGHTSSGRAQIRRITLPIRDSGGVAYTDSAESGYIALEGIVHG